MNVIRIFRGALCLVGLGVITGGLFIIALWRLSEIFEAFDKSQATFLIVAGNTVAFSLSLAIAGTVAVAGMGWLFAKEWIR